MAVGIAEQVISFALLQHDLRPDDYRSLVPSTRTLNEVPISGEPMVEGNNGSVEISSYRYEKDKELWLKVLTTAYGQQLFLNRRITKQLASCHHGSGEGLEEEVECAVEQTKRGFGTVHKRSRQRWATRATLQRTDDVEIKI